MRGFNLNRLLYIVFPYLPIFLAGLIVFWPTFDLYTNADNWMVFWGSKTTMGTVSRWDAWTTYFSPYGGSYLVLFLMSKLFGYDGTPLYVLNFVFRFIAAGGLYVLLNSLNIKRPIALLLSVLFIVSPIGLEVTDWVFQMTSYLSIFFFVMAAGLIFNLDSKKRVFVALALIFGSVAVNPIRAHGIFLTLWLVMIMGLISERRSKRKFLVVLLLFSIILFLFLLNKQTFGDPVANTAMLNPGIAVVRSSFEVGDLTIPAHYFRNLGSGLIPNSIVEELSKLNITQVLLRSYHPGIEIVVWAGGMLGFLLFYKRYLFANRNSRVLIVIYSVAILTFVYLANKILLASNLTVNSRISATFGFTFLFTMVLFTIFDAINKNAEKAKLDALILGVCGFFILVPWIHDPINHLTTTHRYLIFSSLLAPLLLADFSSSLLSSRKIIVYIGILLLIGTFASITVFEIDQMSKRHGRFYGETLWGQIDRYFGDENLKDERSVVYFASDNNRQLHDLIISSFGFRMGLYYDIWDFDKLPYAIESLDDFRSMLTDGEASFKYIGKVHTFEMKDAYAFEIKDNQVRKLDISKLLY